MKDGGYLKMEGGYFEFWGVYFGFGGVCWEFICRNVCLCREFFLILQDKFLK